MVGARRGRVEGCGVAMDAGARVGTENVNDDGVSVRRFTTFGGVVGRRRMAGMGEDWVSDCGCCCGSMLLLVLLLEGSRDGGADKPVGGGDMSCCGADGVLVLLPLFVVLEPFPSGGASFARTLLLVGTDGDSGAAAAAAGVAVFG